MKAIYFLIAGICLVAAAGILGGAPLPTDSPNNLNEYEEQTFFVQTLTSDIQNHTKGLCDELLAAAAYQANISADDPQVAENLTNIYTRNPGSTALYRINADNVIVAAVPESAQFRKGYHTDAFTFEQDTAFPLSITAFHRENSEWNNISLLVPVNSPDGTDGGYIGTTLDAKEFFGPALSKVPRSQGFTVLILDETGDILFSDDTTRIGENVLALSDKSGITDTETFTRMITTPSGNITFTTFSFGELKYITLASAWETVETPYGNISVMVGKKTGEQWTSPRPVRSSDATLEEFVNSAYQYAATHDLNATIAAFNDPAGPFVTQKYAVTAVDMNGTVLASAMRPGDVGLDMGAVSDENGVTFIRSIMQRANQGGGYVTSVDINPLTSDTHSKMKRSYVVPVDDTWFVFAGTYLDDPNVYVDPNLRLEMIRYTRDIRQYSLDYGSNVAVAALNTPNGQFYREDIPFLIAVTSNGLVLARPADPELTGMSITGSVDAYGASFGRDLLTMARTGGGMVYEYYPNRITGENEMTLIYVLPVDDTWFLASGITMTVAP